MIAKDRALLDGIQQMADQAAEIGLCPMVFKTLKISVAEIIEEKDQLINYRVAKPVLPYKGYAGQCPSCGVVFLDNSTLYCGNCGQALRFTKPE